MRLRTEWAGGLRHSAQAGAGGLRHAAQDGVGRWLAPFRSGRSGPVACAIAAAVAGGQIARDDLFLQTKYTFQRGQDHRLPYDPATPIAIQVEESFASSLEHLDVERIDSYLLHGPSRSVGLGAEDWAAWQAMEKIHESGRARLLGVSNVALDQLEILCKGAKEKPHFVQNRCFAVSGWDRAIRLFCKTNGIVYQAFSLLTANRNVIASQHLVTLAELHRCSPAQLIFRFAIDVGMIPLPVLFSWRQSFGVSNEREIF